MTIFFKILIGFVALSLGCWTMGCGVVSLLAGYSSSSWPKTTGVIQESQINGSLSSSGPRGGGRASHFPTVIYSYKVDGRSYTGSRIDTRWAWNQETSRQIVNAFPPGSVHTVYYSAAHPEDSMLLAGLHRNSFFGVILGALILSFAALMGTVTYMAPRYGRSAGGHTYSFSDNSPVAPVIITGMFVIIGLFGLLFWTAR